MAARLEPLLASLIPTYGDIAATVAADLYDEMRDAAAVARSFSAVTAPLPDSERAAVLARWGVSPMLGASPDVQAALTLVAGGLQRIIADAHRETVALSVAKDPAQARYARYARAGACDFCSMLAGRGAIYGGKAGGAGGRYHDHCSCIALPSWE